MSEFKFNCPYCLQKFASDHEDIGKAAVCPSCQKEITITPPLGHEICDVKYTGPKQITIPAQTEQTPQPKPGDVQVNAKDSVAGCVGCLVVIAILIGFGFLGECVHEEQRYLNFLFAQEGALLTDHFQIQIFVDKFLHSW